MRHVKTEELRGFKWERAGDEPHDYIQAVDKKGNTVAIFHGNRWPEDDWKLWELTTFGEELITP